MADRAYLQRLSKELADRGKLIEAGWIGYRLAVLPDTAGKVQLDETHLAFFAGAQHLFTSMMTIMEPGAEPTNADLNRMGQIHDELADFGEKFALRSTSTKGSA
ncbi:hypothetical protein [Bradyrhizobium sp. S3.7.6]